MGLGAFVESATFDETGLNIVGGSGSLEMGSDSLPIDGSIDFSLCGTVVEMGLNILRGLVIGMVEGGGNDKLRPCLLAVMGEIGRMVLFKGSFVKTGIGAGSGVSSAGLIVNGPSASTGSFRVTGNRLTSISDRPAVLDDW